MPELPELDVVCEVLQRRIVVSANQRLTNFCRACQPGGLIKGM
jgi:hypothetical protein